MISIIIPFYNEKENLPILVDLLVRELMNKKYEIILVDDGSDDKYQISNIKSQTNLKLIKHKTFLL